MTDKKTLDLARQWASDIDADRQTLSQDTIDAAADLISSLPDAWVGVDTLREFISEWRTDCPAGDGPMILEQLESLLPSPDPAAPRPEDVPVGEPWQVEVNGKAAIGYRNDPESRLCWAVVFRDDANRDWVYDSDVTLIARLVPETTEQDTETVFDPDYIYIDRDGDEWEYIDGGWITGDTHAKRVAERKVHLGHDSPPEGYGPYRKDRLVPASAEQDDGTAFDPHTRIEA